jgi:fatty-acid desaturase
MHGSNLPDAAAAPMPCLRLFCLHALILASRSCLQTTKERVYDQSNAKEMESQAWYRWIRETYPWHVVAQLVALYAFGGLGGLVWGGALRMVWVYHITWFVNSASHCWGNQTYNTGDLSRNNWCVAGPSSSCV